MLHQAGHASWLETAQQRATVEALIEHQRATVEFRKWLSKFRTRLSLDGEATKAHPPVSSPSEVPRGNDDDRDGLQLARRAMEEAQREFDNLQTPGEDGDETVHATVLQPARKADDNGRLTQLEILQLTFHPELARATLRAAEVQSDSQGYEKMAGLLVRKAQLRLEGVRALYERGLATSVELERARSTIAIAEDVLDKAHKLARKRHTDWTSLQQQLAVDDKPQRPTLGEPNDDLHTVAADPAAVRILIGLQLARCQAAARRKESDIEAQLLGQLVQRLERAGLDHDSGRRERQMARLNLQLAQARGEVAAEQHVALQHQTRQLVAAVRAQRRQARVTGLVASAATLVAPRLAVSYLQWPKSPLFSSFAIPPQPALIAWNVPGCFYWRDVGYWYGRRARVLPLNYGLWGFGRSAWWTRHYFAFGPYGGGFYHHSVASRLGLRSYCGPWPPTLSCRVPGLSYPRYRVHISSLRSYLSALP
jgi:hypothetical protein